MVIFFRHDSKQKCTNATIKIINDQVFIECPGETFNVDDRLDAEIDGKKMSFNVKRLAPDGVGVQIQACDETKGFEFVRAFSDWLLIIMGLVDRRTAIRRLHQSELWLKVSAVCQNGATFIAAIGLFFGLFALLRNETLSEKTSELCMIAMIATVLGFAIVWGISIIFQIIAYWYDRKNSNI